MERIEMVEKLREKASVSYEEAKAALEASDWDILDAMVLLEQQGKIREEEASIATYTTKRQAPPQEEQFYEGPKHRRKEAGDLFSRFVSFVGKLIHKGNTNHIHVVQHGEMKMSLPVTAFVLLLIFAFPFMIVLLVASLFFGFGYELVGPDLGKEEINEVISKAAEAAESMKEEFQEKYETRKEEQAAKKAEKEEK